MLEQWQKLTSVIKSVIMWVITPVALVFMTIAYLLYKNSNLKNRLLESQADGVAAKDKGLANDLEKKSATSLDDYRRLRGEYLGDGSDPKDSA